MTNRLDGSAAPENAAPSTPLTDTEIIAQLRDTICDMESTIAQFGAVVEALYVLSENMDLDNSVNRSVLALIDVTEKNRRQVHQSFFHIHELVFKIGKGRDDG